MFSARYETIRFKNCFPTKDSFINILKEFNITEEDANIIKYDYIMRTIGNSWLLFKNADLNYSNIQLAYLKHLNVYKRQIKFYNKELEDSLVSESTNEITNYTVNRTELNDVSSDFIDNAVKSTNRTKIPYIDRLKEIKELNSMENPLTFFINKFFKEILLPIRISERSI